MLTRTSIENNTSPFRIFVFLALQSCFWLMKGFKSKSKLGKWVCISDISAASRRTTNTYKHTSLEETQHVEAMKKMIWFNPPESQSTQTQQIYREHAHAKTGNIFPITQPLVIVIVLGNTVNVMVWNEQYTSKQQQTHRTHQNSLFKSTICVYNVIF